MMMTQKHLIQSWPYGCQIFTQRHTYTQQVSLSIVQHNDHLLCTKWKWIIIKVFILISVTLRRLRGKKRGWSCCLRVADPAEVEEVEAKEEREAHLA